MLSLSKTTSAGLPKVTQAAFRSAMAAVNLSNCLVSKFACVTKFSTKEACPICCRFFQREAAERI